MRESCPKQPLLPSKNHLGAYSGRLSSDINHGLSVRQSDGSFTIGGHSRSGISGTRKSSNYGLYELWLAQWVVRVDARGNKLYEQTFGGTGTEGIMAWGSTSFAMVRILPTSDGGVLLAGISDSPESGMKTSPAFGRLDYWVLTLGPEPPRVQAKAMSAELRHRRALVLLSHCAT
ncbi:MAG: hypothetical protein AB9869_31740 [Verrucomicrobiia bacterium]